MNVGPLKQPTKAITDICIITDIFINDDFNMSRKTAKIRLGVKNVVDGYEKVLNC